MSRGYIFEISTNKKDIGNMEESDFYDQLLYLNVDYVQDVHDEDKPCIREGFLDILEKYGAKVTTIGKESYAISSLGKSFQRNYFQERFKSVQEMVTNLTNTHGQARGVAET